MKITKRALIPAVLLACLLIPTMCSNRGSSGSNKENEVPSSQEEKNPLEMGHYRDVPSHLVLIYDGGSHRKIKWDEERLTPYVSDKVNGKEEWMFDGFLFLEILDGQGRGFASGYADQPARKQEWKGLLDHYFENDGIIHALDRQVAIAKELIEEENFSKRKIVLSVPEPIPNQTDWGNLNGRALDFSKMKDRYDACKWFIDYAEDLFQKSDFQNLELVGFYWLAEEATNSRGLSRHVANYLYSKEYDFYWIPYFFSDGYNEWKDLGFNTVYYQPNYFFDDDIEIERLQKTVDRAKANQMSLEIEFDERVLKNSGDWGYRLHDYLDVYERNRVFDTYKLAYYQGNDTFYRLSISEESSDVLLYNRLKSIVAKKL